MGWKSRLTIDITYSRALFSMRMITVTPSTALKAEIFHRSASSDARNALKRFLMVGGFLSPDKQRLESFGEGYLAKSLPLLKAVGMPVSAGA